MRMVALGLLIMTGFFLTGCVTDNPSQIIGSPTGHDGRGGITRQAQQGDSDDVRHAAEDRPVPLTVLYRGQAASRGMYEPSQGVYLGAWLHPSTGFRTFESEAGRHAAYVFEMHLEDDIPVNWLLNVIAAQATPVLIIHPPRAAFDYAEDTLHSDLIIQLAYRLGAFNLPMFVAFYPLPYATQGAVVSGGGMIAETTDTVALDATEYTLMFRYARAVFMQYAPLAAFVWVAPGLHATPQNAFYPGHAAVDWVGVSLLARRDEIEMHTTDRHTAGQPGESFGQTIMLENETLNETISEPNGFVSDIVADFEPFYMAFHEYKPIMLLPLGISHFSRIDYTYHITPAAHELSRVYHALANGFPRLGMIVYNDRIGVPDNFSITVEESLTQAYAEATRNTLATALPTPSHVNHFMTSIEKNAPVSLTWVRSAFHGYRWQDRIFINPNTLSQEIGVSLPRGSLTEINAQGFLDISRIDSINAGVDLERGVVLIGQ